MPQKARKGQAPLLRSAGAQALWGGEGEGEEVGAWGLGKAEDLRSLGMSKDLVTPIDRDKDVPAPIASEPAVAAVAAA
jgi:hypothetical protein